MSSLSAPTCSAPSSIEAKFMKWLGLCTWGEGVRGGEVVRQDRH